MPELRDFTFAPGPMQYTGKDQPCTVCAGPTFYADPDGRPVHIACYAQDERPAELGDAELLDLIEAKWCRGCNATHMLRPQFDRLLTLARAGLLPRFGIGAEYLRQRDAARGLAAALEAELARVRAAIDVGATPALIAEILDEALDG